MYNRYIKELPIYKVHFDDKEKHQLYISSRTGEVQQFTTQSERIWAYVGVIPHKLYIPALRENTGLWTDVVAVLSVICLLVGISGLYVGLDVCVRRYRKTKIFRSPYRNKMYRWHHVSGIIFSIFIISWSLCIRWLVNFDFPSMYTKSLLCFSDLVFKFPLVLPK